MKGIIFNVLNQLVEEKFGEEMWEELLDSQELESEGAYTSAATYSDEELFALVGALSAKTGVAVPDLVRTFGEYTLGELAKLYPNFFDGKDIKSFLLSIHDVVHVEVRKLYPDAGLPEFTYEDPGENQLIMHYKSPRKLSALAQGLIAGAGKHFQVEIEQKLESKIEGEEEHCKFTLNFKK